MRNDSIEIPHANAKGRTQRVWYGHGSSRLITDNARDLPPADVIDEAIAGFERVDAPARPVTIAHAAMDHQPFINSLAADLSTQLAALDRQRDHLARLLHDIKETPVSKYRVKRAASLEQARR